jgi:hypothetical protein
LVVTCGANSRLRLPVRHPSAADAALADFPPPETAAPIPLEQLRTSHSRKTITHDQVGGWTELRFEDDGGRLRYTGSGMEVDDRAIEITSVRDGDPLSLRVEIERRVELQRGAWRVWVQSRCAMTADATHFHLSHTLDAYEDDTRVFSRSSTKAIPREMV